MLAKQASFRSVIAAIVSLCIGLVFAHTTFGDDELLDFNKEKELTEISTALGLSGIRLALSEIDVTYSRNLERQLASYQLTGLQRQQLYSIAADYKANDIVSELQQYLLVAAKGRSMDAVLDPLRHEISEKFRRFERIMATARQQEKLKNYLKNNPQKEKRLHLLRQCHQLAPSNAIAAILQSYAEVDMAVALDFIGEEFISRNDPEGIKLWRSKLEKRYAKEYLSLADDYSAFAYRLIRDEQLEQYIKVWQDRNLQWFVQTALAGVRKILLTRREILLDNFNSVIELENATEG